MKVVKFEGADKFFYQFRPKSENSTAHSGSLETKEIPYKNVFGCPIVCMEFTDKEVEDIINNKRIYITIPVICDSIKDGDAFDMPIISTTL